MAGRVLARIGHVVGDAEDALIGEIERRRKDLLHRHVAVLTREAQPALEEAELPTRRECGAREHRGLDPVEEERLEDRRQVERHRRARHILPLPPALLGPTHPWRSPCDGTKCGIQPVRRTLQPPHHRPALGQELVAPLARVPFLHPVGDGGDVLLDPAETAQHLVELGREPFGPDRVGRELVGEPEGPLLAFEPRMEPEEKEIGGALGVDDAGGESLAEEIERGRVIHVVGLLQENDGHPCGTRPIASPREHR